MSELRDSLPNAPWLAMMIRRCTLVALATLGSAVFSACGEGSEPYQTVAGGDAARGKTAFVAYGCGACHTLSDVRTAVGTVGPPLSNFGRQVFIAGRLPNTGEGLVRWIEDPQTIAPGTAMPNLGVSERDARDIAAYLLTRRSSRARRFR